MREYNLGLIAQDIENNNLKDAIDKLRAGIKNHIDKTEDPEECKLDPTDTRVLKLCADIARQLSPDLNSELHDTPSDTLDKTLPDILFRLYKLTFKMNLKQ